MPIWRMHTGSGDVGVGARRNLESAPPQITKPVELHSRCRCCCGAALFTRTSDLVQKLQVARRELSLEAAIATLSLYAVAYAVEHNDPGRPRDPNYRYVARSQRVPIKPVPPEELALFRAMLPRLQATTLRLWKAGVTLLASTDVAADRVPGFSLHEELDLLAAAGCCQSNANRSPQAASRALCVRLSWRGSATASGRRSGVPCRSGGRRGGVRG